MSYYRTPGMVNVRYWREKRGLTIAGLAEASDLSETTIRVADNASGRGPSIKESTVKKIAAALKVPIYEITVGPEELAVLDEMESG